MSKYLVNEIKVLTTIKVYSDGSTEECTKTVSSNKQDDFRVARYEHTISQDDYLRKYLRFPSKSDISEKMYYDFNVRNMKRVQVKLPNGEVIVAGLYNISGKSLRLTGLKRLYEMCNVGSKLLLEYNEGKVIISF